MTERQSSCTGAAHPAWRPAVQVGRANDLAYATQVRFWCADVAADVRELLGRGVEFDVVEFGDYKMLDHVLTTLVGSSAWFKDPDGITFALFQTA